MILKKRTLLLIILLLSVNWLFAGGEEIATTGEKKTEKKNYGWLEIGLGMANIHGYQKTAGAIQFTKQFRKNIFSLRLFMASEMLDEGPYDNANEIGFLYGRIFSFLSNRLNVSFSGGIAFTGVKEEPYANNTTKTIGFPLEIKVSFHICSFFGVSIANYINLNSLQVYGGGLLMLKFGRF